MRIGLKWLKAWATRRGFLKNKMTFDDLGLSPEILKAIAEIGYTTPTPIQEKAIPHILMTRDLVGLAQTGTGKTAGFILPMIEILASGRAKARMPRSLILSPTRELAAQVAENFDTYGKYHPLTKALLVGGTSMGDQIRILEKGADVLIATPGRLLDLLGRGNVLLNDIRILVIDEADRMLDMGFIPDIEKIIAAVPPVRQTLMFSATMPPEIGKLAEKFLTNPKFVSVAPPASPAETVAQFLVRADGRHKKQALKAILKKEEVRNAFIFLNRKRDVSTLARWLSQEGYSAAPLHGDMVQSARTRTLLDFREDRISLMVCSDVAARGLDIQGVSHVINYDVPFSAEDYVHRIGRTGRAGLQGRAWTLASPDEDKLVDAIEKLIKRPIEQVEGIVAPAVPRTAEDRPARAGKPAPASRSRAAAASGPARPRPASPDRARTAPAQTDSQTSPPSAPVRQASARPVRPARPAASEDAGDVVGFGDDVPAFLRRG